MNVYDDSVNGVSVSYRNFNSQHLLYVTMDGKLRRLMFEKECDAKNLMQSLSVYEKLRIKLK